MVVSLSGVDPRNLERCADLADDLGSRSVPLTLLVAPRLAGAATADWVRARRAAGDPVLMHGSDHVPNPLALRLGRRAEFAALTAHEAGLRLTAASAAMDRAGLVADGFAGHRWLVSAGSRAALAARGFRLCADQLGVDDLHTGVRHRARVVGLRGRERTEALRCFALVLAAARVTRRGGTLRLAVDAAELERAGQRAAVVDAVDAALDGGAVGVTYLGLVGASVPAPRARVVSALPDRVRG
ncbi:DUF2334 domain-containing protein [Actinokineospora bangkokensis]|uniref:DUF2334 domain-containing protein n=1 Tax=Actinokineospora bangkokensis TaxID=1193682 RepID=A0A1Q9LGX8_9PSEU|nr:DUF2334 domain-containing protein [Actinokineospora bangkokensis]